MEKSNLYTLAEGSSSTIFAAFLNESLGHIIPWMIVAFFVILCDLVVGIRKSLIMKEEVRFSSACRRTMGKTISYFAFVVMVAVMDVAAHGGGVIDKYACLLVCFIEFTSIISNILKPRGVRIDLAEILAFVFSKRFGVDKEDVKEIIKEDKE